MKVKGLQNGRIYNFPPSNCVPLENETINRSELHLRARKLLKEQYPLYRILEEVTIPNSNLRLDFFISNTRTGYEINGQQHSQYNSFFFKTKYDYNKAKSNDIRKEEWCLANNIKLVQLNFDESEAEWLEKI
jgi:hypothetical protein